MFASLIGASARLHERKRTNYKGLFSTRLAPSKRAYCILFSFVFGVLELTAGGVFYHSLHSLNSDYGRTDRRILIALSTILLALGLVTLFTTAWVISRFGFDDASSNDDEEKGNFSKQDELDQTYNSNSTLTQSI